MSNFLQWAKSNPVTIGCLLLVLLALGSFVWPTGGLKKGVLDEAATIARMKRTIENKMRSTHPLPIKPVTGPGTFTGPIRETDLAELERIFEKMGTGYRQLFSNVLSINRYGLRNEQGQPISPHRPLVDRLFPQIPDAKRFNARQKYVDNLQQLYTSLQAGTPPTKAQIESELKRVEEDFRASILVLEGELTTDQKRELAERTVKARREMILSKARSIKLYGAPPTFFTTQPTGIFSISNLALSTAQPTDWDIWEGQMNLWIQQDICTAIRLANSGSRDGRTYNSVIDAPVKQITQIEVLPMYVGVPRTGLGAAATETDNTSTSPSAAPPEAGFTVSPVGTGRQSNPLYDVRLATVTLVIDPARINDLFDWLAQVNFITPTVNSIARIDKRVAFENSYYYGADEVVMLNMTLEFCWLRRWTAGHLTPDKAQEEFQNWLFNADPTQLTEQQQALVDAYKALSDPAQQLELIKKEYFDQGLMPDVVRYYLGLPPLDPNYAPPGSPSSPGTTNSFDAT